MYFIFSEEESCRNNLMNLFKYFVCSNSSVVLYANNLLDTFEIKDQGL